MSENKRKLFQYLSNETVSGCFENRLVGPTLNGFIISSSAHLNPAIIYPRNDTHLLKRELKLP